MKRGSCSRRFLPTAFTSCFIARYENFPCTRSCRQRAVQRCLFAANRRRVHDDGGDFAEAPPPPSPAGAPPGCGFTQRYRPQDNRGPVMQLRGSSGTPLAQLARLLGNELDREVIDDTGITGTYDMRLDYAPDDSLLARLTPGAKPLDNTLAPSLFTALQEQLGSRAENPQGSGRSLCRSITPNGLSR